MLTADLGDTRQPSRPRHLRACRSSACADLVAHLLGPPTDSRPRHQPRAAQPPDERVFPGDSVPSDGSRPTQSSRARTHAAAVQLFADRATAVVPDFFVSPGNRLTSKPSADRLDGLPLAIELAALQVPLFTVHDLLARLTQRLDASATWPAVCAGTPCQPRCHPRLELRALLRPRSRRSGSAARSSAEASSLAAAKLSVPTSSSESTEVLPGSRACSRSRSCFVSAAVARCDSGCWTRSATTVCADWNSQNRDEMHTPPGSRSLRDTVARRGSARTSEVGSTVVKSNGATSELRWSTH